ncbi:MAG: hypothetical protein VX712_11585 [Bacteroidota bacterium]|nr:hypothetical protein [Bacteroidota bacterium]
MKNESNWKSPMQYIMKNKLAFIHFLGLLWPILMNGQLSTLSSSPYSLYGLGVYNYQTPGKANALGYTGIADNSFGSINKLNPASFAGIPLNTFTYDVGLRYEVQNLQQSYESETKNSGNFSGISFAFPVTEKSGMGIILAPYTNVGYEISGIQSNIEGTDEIFLTNVEGHGGLNDLNLNYGYAFSENLRVGLSSSFLFGKITENEYNYFVNNTLYLREDNSYSGFRFGFGIQYDFLKNTSLGAVVNSPVNLKSVQEQEIFQYRGGITGTLLGTETIETSNDDFILPLEIGMGFKTELIKELMISADYRHEFWDQTNQTDDIGDFIDRDFYGLGLEYLPENRMKTKAMEYRLGLKYDSGNMNFNGENVSGYGLSTGVGIPLNLSLGSMINLSYTYGDRGTISNGLVRENYHLLTLNLSLIGNWFTKRRFY